MIEMMLSTLFSIPSNVKPGGAEDPWHWDVSLSHPLCPPLPLLQKTIPLSPHQHLGTSFETFPSRLWCHLKSRSTKLPQKLDSPISRWTPGTSELRKNMTITNPNTVRHLASRILSDILCCERGKHNSFTQCNLISAMCPQSYVIWITTNFSLWWKI